MVEIIDPETCVDWDAFFEQQTGGGAFFQGEPYQRGHGLGNIFRGIFRFLLPIAKTAASTLGKEALNTGANILTDSLKGENIKEVAKRRWREGATSLVDKAKIKLDQSGKGMSRKRQTRKGIKRNCSTPRKRRTTIGIPKRRKKRDAFDDDSSTDE